MSQLPLLWLMVAALLCLFGLGWLAVARLPGEISPQVRAAGWFNLLFGIGLGLVALRGWLPYGLTHTGSSLVQFAAFAMGWRAVDHLLLRRRSREPVIVAGLAGAATVLLAVIGAGDEARVALLHVAQAYFLLRIEHIHGPRTRDRYGRKKRWLLRSVCWGVAAVVLVRTAVGLWADLPLAVTTPGRPDNYALTFVALFTMCVLNGLGGYGVLSDLYAELNRQTGLDVLTGLPNRRAMATFTERHWRLWQRHGRPFAVACIDVDHFKSINDRFGHAVGDAVLQQVAQALRETLRRTDDLARQGGEEFTVFLPEGDPPGDTHAMAERLRAAVQALRLPPEVGAQVTVSIGVSTVSPADRTAAEVLARGDRALYAAKEAGRNRVVVLDAAGSSTSDGDALPAATSAPSAMHATAAQG